MLELAKRSDEDRSAIFTSAALKMGMNEAIVEKERLLGMLDVGNIISSL